MRDPIISRRYALLGLTAIAAPFVIRTPCLLMPVRNRILPPMYNEHRFRNWKAYPPSLDEVKEWRAGLDWMHDQGMFVSWSAQGFDNIHHMGDAERRFEAMGLL